MSKQKILNLATFTLVGMGGLGLSIIVFVWDASVSDALMLQNWLEQLISGSIYGMVIAFIGWQLISLPFLKSTKEFFCNLIGSFKLSMVEIIYISFCAGVGEELLFRGGVQPWLGIWFTSVIFVAVHGYLNPKNLPLSLYGLFMVFGIAGIGYLAETYGLLSAIIAHITIDIFLFWKLSAIESLTE